MKRIEIGKLVPPDGIAVELGVARGIFSELILKTYPNMTLYSIDRWAGDRGHDDEEFQVAEALLRPYPHSSIIRATFQFTVPQFDDGELDWIFIDGYAHTGQDDGQTLRDWWPKVKVGGIFSGHDYTERWPKTIKQVDKFAKELGVKIFLTDSEEYISWYWKKG